MPAAPPHPTQQQQIAAKQCPRPQPARPCLTSGFSVLFLLITSRLTPTMARAVALPAVRRFLRATSVTWSFLCAFLLRGTAAAAWAAAEPDALGVRSKQQMYTHSVTEEGMTQACRQTAPSNTSHRHTQCQESIANGPVHLLVRLLQSCKHPVSATACSAVPTPSGAHLHCPCYLPLPLLRHALLSAIAAPTPNAYVLLLPACMKSSCCCQ